MTGGPVATARPVVLVPHGYRSIPPLQLAAAATDVCDLVWLVRGRDPELASVGRLLGRLGSVVEVDGLDADQVSTAVARYHPAGVVAFRDQDLVPMAAVAQRLGLDFHAPVVAQRLADKVDQRQALRHGGVPVPSWWEIASRRDTAAVKAVAGQVTYPAVVKPRQGSGSWHTFPVGEAGDLITALEGLGHTEDEAMIVEQYLPSAAGADQQRFADYVSVESLGTPTGMRHVAVTGRLHPVAPFRETGFFVPSDLGRDETAPVLAMATDALAALGVRSGCVHTEIKLTPAGPRVIEVNGRLGGGIRDIVLAAGGADLLALHLRCALGQPVDLGGPAARAVGYRLFYQPPVSARRVRSISGLETVGSLPGVDEVSLHLHPGDPIDAAQGSRSYVFSVVGSAADPADVDETNRRMYELADVTYDHVTNERADDARATA